MGTSRLGQRRDIVRVATAGSVDDGKSTLIGRLLFDSGAIYEDHVRAVQQASRQHGFTEIDLSLFTDGLAAEREQQITIDVAYRYFTTARRRFVIADVPGHEEYTRNMVTGVSTADVALVLVDVRHGVVTQARRHLFVCSLLNIGHVLIVLNKMDAVDYRQDVFTSIHAEITSMTHRLPIRDLQFMPVSALAGDMVVERGTNLSWYHGRTLLDYLENVEVSGDRNLIDLRLPVQNVLRPDQSFRGFAGLVESGIVRVGDPVVVLPSKSTSRVKEIFVAGDAEGEAWAGQAVSVTLADEVDASRGSMIARPDNQPTVASHIEAALCWFSTAPLEAGRSYLLKHTTRTVRAFVDQLRYRINMDSLHRESSERLEHNEIGRAYLTTATPLVFDPYVSNRGTGGFILVDEITRDTVAAGVIVRARDLASPAVDARRSVAASGAIVWFTGLPGSGKTTIATAVAARLTASGIDVEHLDGDEFRQTFSRDLGFTADDRTRNIERASQIAGLLVKHRVIVLASFVSPARSHRAMVKQAAPNVLEVFVNAPLEVCMERDPKGLYREAKAGGRPWFTGVGDAYEPPENPDLELRTDRISSHEATNAVLQLLTERGIVL
jgi:bifunctional enzyme CysN/CysC